MGVKIFNIFVLPGMKIFNFSDLPVVHYYWVPTGNSTFFHTHLWVCLFIFLNNKKLIYFLKKLYVIILRDLVVTKHNKLEFEHILQKKCYVMEKRQYIFQPTSDRKLFI
jgi:hypothetical protein